MFAIIIFKKIFGGKWYFALKLHLLKEFPGSFYETELLKPGPYYVHRVQVRAPFHILILIISLVVLRAYLCKDTLHLFYRGPYFTCQPYRVEKVEQDRFAAEDRFHRARNLRPPTEWYSTSKETWIFPNKKMNYRVSALLCYELCLLANTVCSLLQPNILLCFCAEKAFTNLCQEVINVHRNQKIFFVLATCKRWNSIECREERLAR